MRILQSYIYGLMDLSIDRCPDDMLSEPSYYEKSASLTSGLRFRH
jgi:hypothetical protein